MTCLSSVLTHHMKTILITWSSSGIGKATAHYFAQKGRNVVATMRSPEKETELTKVDNILVTTLDVTKKETIQQAIQKWIDTFGTIDVVVNNAGYGTAGAFEAATDEQIRRQFDVNLFGLFDVTKAMLPHFREKKSGLFINISSIGWLVTFPTFSLYHATKWAVEWFSESLSFELAPLGIKVKIVEPGWVQTDFAGRSLDILEQEGLHDYDETVNKIRSFFSQSDRAAQYSTAEHIASIIFDAATDENDRMRYLAGNDAQAMWKQRQALGDDAFRWGIAQQFLQ